MSDERGARGLSFIVPRSSFGVTSAIGRLAGAFRLRGPVAWIAGAVSGFFGGLVGNQGGSAPRHFWDSTYPAMHSSPRRPLMTVIPIIVVATVGVIAGTVGGTRLPRQIPQQLLDLLVSLLITALGIYMLGKGVRWWP